ncbi:MAG: threonine/serine dehydratase [Candidatus Aminicenantes bacterium]|nr:threonine/serine dehydratase [Candidatus Aminicenantes bacterium]
MGIDAHEIRKEVLKAEKRIRTHIRETPLEYSPFLSQLGDCEAYLKLENIQLTGSFKLRGAMNKLLSLDQAKREKGIITASSGNHGMAFAYLTQTFGFKGTIFLPKITSSTKIDALNEYGAKIRFYGDDCVKAEMQARATAEREGLTFMSAYNDLQVIAGQGTIGLELEKQLKSIDAIFAPVGGGGLIGGIAGYLKSGPGSIEIIGCQPYNSAVMYESVKADRLLDLESKPTISDGTAGGIEPGAITFPICRNLVDTWAVLSEEEIIEALKLILAKHYLLIEGAAALSVAAFLKDKDKLRGKTIVLILSGGKIGLETLKKIL